MLWTDIPKARWRAPRNQAFSNCWEISNTGFNFFSSYLYFLQTESAALPTAAADETRFFDSLWLS